MVEEKTPLIFTKERYGRAMSTNKKLIRNIIIAVAVIAFLGVIYYFALKWEPENKKTTEEKNIHYILSESIDDIEALHIKNLKSEYDIVLTKSTDGKKTFTIPELSGKDVNRMQLENTVISIITLCADNTVANDVSEISQYGLDASEIYCTVKRTDGSSITVMIGDETPTGGEYYCMVDREDDVYIISSYKTGLFTAVPNDYRVTDVLKLSDVWEVKELSLSKNSTPVLSVRAATEDEQQSGNLMSGRWKMTYPWEEDIDTEKFADVLNNLISIEAIGFADEYTDVSFDYAIELSTLDSKYKFSIGGLAPNGGVYLHDGRNLYIVDSTLRKTVEKMNPNDYLVKIVALAYIDDISGVVVQHGNTQYTMNPGNDDGEPYIICGKEVSEEKFKKIYQTLVGILYTERKDVSVGGNPILKVMYEYKDGGREAVGYYKYDERNMIAVRPDGTTVKVLKSEIDKILELIDD